MSDGQLNVRVGHETKERLERIANARSEHGIQVTPSAVAKAALAIGLDIIEGHGGRVERLTRAEAARDAVPHSDPPPRAA